MSTSLEETIGRVRSASPGALPRNFSECVLDQIRIAARRGPLIVSGAGLFVTAAGSVIVAAVLSVTFAGPDLPPGPPTLSGFSTDLPILSP